MTDLVLHAPDCDRDEDCTCGAVERAERMAERIAGQVGDGPQVDIPDALLKEASFLCGSAGTGKTTLAQAMTRQLPGTILAATTGIAAVNLGEGTTINALLGYYDTASLRESFLSGFLTARLGKWWRAGVRRIVCDEVSMMDGEQTTLITQALDELAGRGYTRDASLADQVAEAQGGSTRWPIALNLIGDFAQLPPVKAPFAFESPEWGRYVANTHRLTKIWRQSDVPFIEALQAARRGEARPVVDFFAPSLVTTTDEHFEGATLFATNDEVARYNYLRMSKLPGEVIQLQTTVWGTQRGDWKNVPGVLEVKIGALVMILANKREATLDGIPGPLIYANGDLGTVAAADVARGVVHVTLLRNGRTVEVDEIRRVNDVPIEPGRKTILRAAGQAELITEDGRREIVGTIDYVPLRVAYGTTIHKSQGLSLDRVQINTRAGFFKTPGMLYVGLSRCRTAEGLRIIGSPDGLRERVTVSAKVREWL